MRINHEQRLYVIPCGEGYTSCLGFDVAATKTAQVSRFLGLEPDTSEPGTEAAYIAYTEAMRLGAEKARRTGKRDESELCAELRIYEGDRIEATDRFGERRRFWVGKSTGWRPCHLEVKTTRSMGGDPAFGPYTAILLVKRGPR